MLAGTNTDGVRVALDENGTLRVKPGDIVEVSIEGLASGSDVEAWLFSDPTSLGVLKATALGVVNGQVVVPDSIDEGAHTLVLKMKNSAGEPVEIGLGIAVGAMSKGPSTAGVMVTLLALAVVSAITLPVAVRRRKRVTL